MAVPSKTPITQIALKDETTPALANQPHNDVETNIDAILAYLSTIDTQSSLSYGDLLNPLLHAPLTNGLGIPLGAGDIDFTRATTATYVDRSTGLVKTAAIDEPRFEKGGLLIEGASENLLTYSEQFDNAAWSKINGTVTPNATTAPDGTTTADKFTENTAATVLHTLTQSSISYTTGIYTYSQSFKAAERSEVRLVIYDGTNSPNAWFNLADGTVGTKAGVNLLNAIVEDEGDGWYRCSIVCTVSTGTGSVYFRTGSGSETDSYTGDGTSGVYIWGAQLEQQNFATSYIPTTTTSVTRAADDCTIFSYDNYQYHNVSYVIDFDCLSTLPTNDDCRPLTLKGISGHLRYGTGAWNWVLDGTGGFVSLLDSSIANISNRIITVFDDTNVTVYHNGVQVHQEAIGGALNYGDTEIQIGKYSISSDRHYGHIRNLRIYDKALTPEEARIV